MFLFVNFNSLYGVADTLTVGLKIGILDPGSQNIPLDVSNLRLLKSIYIWWTNSCTTWDG